MRNDTKAYDHSVVEWISDQKTLSRSRMDSRRFKPELSLLRTFECAARHQSFTRAADELSLTQSAVSKQIIALEARLDLQLFSRVRRQVVLTEAGHRFLIDVSEVLRSADEAILRALSASHREKTLAIA